MTTNTYNLQLNDGEKLIYAWDNPNPDYIRVHNNEAKAYAITKHKEASSGIIIYGKFGLEWIANPQSDRPLIKHLLNRIKAGELTNNPS